jgi:hypothetical protein
VRLCRVHPGVFPGFLFFRNALLWFTQNRRASFKEQGFLLLPTPNLPLSYRCQTPTLQSLLSAKNIACRCRRCRCSRRRRCRRSSNQSRSSSLAKHVYCPLCYCGGHTSSSCQPMASQSPPPQPPSPPPSAKRTNGNRVGITEASTSVPSSWSIRFCL